jgi:hypothetical protein
VGMKCRPVGKVLIRHLTSPNPSFDAVAPRTARPYIISLDEAGVAKLVYAPDSKSGEVKLMSVRVRPPAPQVVITNVILF